MAKTDVDTVKNTAVAGSYDYGDYAHEGFEGTKLTDLSIPFINVMQSISPEVEDQTIPGVKAGDLVNSVTKEILRQPLVVIPLEREEIFVEWVPRAKGGGLVDRHLPDSDIVKNVIKNNGGSRLPPKDAEGKRVPFKSPKGNDLIETHYVYALIMNETGDVVEGYCVLSFSSAKIKAYKDWITALFTQKGQPPIFANRAKISTEKVKNEQGTFYIYGIRPFADTWRESLIKPDEEGMKLLKEAKEMRTMIQDGLAKPAYESASNDAGGDGPRQSDRKVDNSNTDDEIPF